MSRAFIVDTNVFYVKAPGMQRNASCLFDGENYMVFWDDERCSESDIFCARVNRNGELIDTAGRIISSAFRRQEAVAACYDGAKYFAVWMDLRNDSSNWHYDIYGTRISRDGVVLDSAGILIADTYWGNRPDVTFDGENYFIVWADQQGSYYDVYGARVDTSGVVLDTNAILISNAYRNQMWSQVAFDGTNFFVVWQDNRHYPSAYCLYGARVNRSGVLIDTNGIRLTTRCNDESFPAIIFDGSNYFLTWTSCDYGYDYNMYGARMNTNGELIDTNWIAISSAEQNQMYSFVTYSGGDYFVVWSDFRFDPGGTAPDIFGARINRDGIVLDSAGIMLSRNTFGYLPSVSFSGDGFLVVWGYYDIYGMRASMSGTPLDSADILISYSANNQEEPTAAGNSENLLAVWLDDRLNKQTGDDIYGMRISREGAVLDSSVIAIDTCSNSYNSKSGLRVGASDTINLVIWGDSRMGDFDVYGKRIDREGRLLDAVPILISDAVDFQMHPSVCFGDSHFFVVWQDRRSGSRCDIYGSRVSQAGAVLDFDGIIIANMQYDEQCPAVAFDGTNFLVVWIYETGYKILGARVDQNGILLDTVPINIAPSFATRWDYPAIAFDGINYLVIWHERRMGLTCDIYGTRVSPDGVTLDTNYIPIAVAPDSQVYPTAIFDGNNFLVAWQDFRSGNNDIYGARINGDGIVIDTFAIVAQPGCQNKPALAPGPDGGRSLVLYSGWLEYVGNKRANAMRICGEMYPPTGIKNHYVYEMNFSRIEAFPNPFTKTVSIKVNYHPKLPRDVTVSIYNITGRLMRRFKPTAGLSSEVFIWEGDDQKDKKLPAGIYFAVLKCGNDTDTEKIIIGR